MKFKFLVLSILVSTFFISCERNKDLTKDEVYQILNEIIADDSLSLHKVCWKMDRLPVNDEYGFSESDKKFIKQQGEIFKTFILDKKALKYYSRKTKSFLFADVDTSCKEGILYHLSFPLISVDRQRVVIENTEDCNCMLGGQGGKDLYVKKNGHWKKVKSFDRWISQNITLHPRRIIKTFNNFKS
jgi:hypothetical protein